MIDHPRLPAGSEPLGADDRPVVDIGGGSKLEVILVHRAVERGTDGPSVRLTPGPTGGQTRQGR